MRVKNKTRIMSGIAEYTVPQAEIILSDPMELLCKSPKPGGMEPLEPGTPWNIPSAGEDALVDFGERDSWVF